MLLETSAPGDAGKVQELRRRMGDSLQLILSIIQRRHRGADNPAVRQELAILLQGVNALGQLQRALDDGPRVDFADQLISSVQQWRRLFQTRRIDMTINVMSVPMPEATASALALIAHELITNCVEHAFAEEGPGLVEVSLLIDEKGFCELSIADDGRGLRGRAAGGGLRMVRAMARRIGGSFTLHEGHGVIASVWFPLPANED